MRTDGASRQRILGGERHRYATASPDTLGTDQMTADDFDGHRREKRKEGDKPVSEGQIQPGVVSRETGRPNLSRKRENSETRMGAGKIHFPSSAHQKQD